MKEWRLLADGSGAIAIDDPVGATYTFVLVEDGKIIEREAPRDGFHTNAKEDIRKILKDQLKALDKPSIEEETRTRIRGL